jgi:hypothetical protein
MRTPHQGESGMSRFIFVTLCVFATITITASLSESAGSFKRSANSNYLVTSDGAILLVDSQKNTSSGTNPKSTIFRVLKFNNGVWTQLGDALEDAESLHYVSGIVSTKDNTLYLSFNFTDSPPTTPTFILFRLRGDRWTPIDTNDLNLGGVSSIAPGENNELFIVGRDRAQDSLKQQTMVYKFSGERLTRLKGVVNTMSSCLLAITPEGKPMLANILSANNTPIDLVGVNDGGTWSTLGEGLYIDGVEDNRRQYMPFFYQISSDNKGSIYFAGQFDFFDRKPAHHLAKWDGKSWRGFKFKGVSKPSYLHCTGIDAANDGSAYALCQKDEKTYLFLCNGDLCNVVNTTDKYLGHLTFTSDNTLYAYGSWSEKGQSKAGVVRWTGSKWEAVGEQRP